MTLDPDSFPRLKPGVKFFKYGAAHQNCIYVGFAHRGIELNSDLHSDLNSEIAPHLLQLLRLLDGSRTLGSIYRTIFEKLSAPIEKQVTAPIDEILLVLQEFGLLEFRISKLQDFREDGLAPVNLVNSTKRMRAEENLFSWHPAVSKEIATESLINNRRNFAIIIFGRNRLALALFSILQASGFSQIKILDRSISAAAAQVVQIAPEEVCGLTIRGSDVGLRKELVLADLARNSKLFPEQNLAFPATPDFIISTEPIPIETLQRWMSEEIPHFAIANLLENTIEIGPIVIPGISPCLNCLKLWREEQFPHQNEFELLAALEGSKTNELELPSAQVALLAGLIAIEVIEFCTSSFGGPAARSELIGVTKTIDLLKPFPGNSMPGNSMPGNSYWQPHSSCGCQRLI